MLFTNRMGETIAKISLGTAPFGSGITEDVAFRLMDRYQAIGGNLLDTARIYSGGHSEEIVGKWIKERKNRDKILISTKGVHPHGDWIPRVNRKELILDLETSLRALDTDYTDIYFLHRDDPQKPVSEIMPTLHEFVKEGKVRFLGASNWTYARIAEANRFAKDNGMTEFTFSQIMWNSAKINKERIGDQTLVVMDEKEYEGYRGADLNVMAYTSQAQGLFSYIQQCGIENIPRHLYDRYVNAETEKRAQRILAIAKETGTSPTAVSIGFLLHDPVNALPIIGVSSVARLEESMQVLSLPHELFL